VPSGETGENRGDDGDVQDEYDLFDERAREWGHTQKVYFEDYRFNHYEHLLVCHAATILRAHGGLGRLMSIVCESYNKVWKRRRSHENNKTTVPSQTHLRFLTATSNPAPFE
jgi:hypothetical protein